MLLFRALYALFVVALAASPILSVWLSIELGYGRAVLRFFWVGPLISLPLPLMIARLSGDDAYRAFWSYLQSYPGNSKRAILTVWSVTVITTMSVGFVAIWAA